MPSWTARRTKPRMTALSPGASPPPVSRQTRKVEALLSPRRRRREPGGRAPAPPNPLVEGQGGGNAGVERVDRAGHGESGRMAASAADRPLESFALRSD